MYHNFNNSFFHFSFNDCSTSLSDFENLIDWLSNEFVLYQQEENQGIKVYFPNGWFDIRYSKENKNEYEVCINSKSKFSFNKIKEQLLVAINRFKHLKTGHSYE